VQDRIFFVSVKALTEALPIKRRNSITDTQSYI